MKTKPPAVAANPDVFRYLRIAIWGLMILLAVGAVPTWRMMQANYGPMSVTFSQCEICGQSRSVEMICGRRVRDEITPTDHSRWLATFASADHQHVWAIGSSTHRHAWFGSQIIACGGNSVLGTIHAQRSQLSEEECRQLVEKYHELIRSPADAQDRHQQVADFAKAVHADPESLLDDR
jgi:hypothetical protein